MTMQQRSSDRKSTNIVLDCIVRKQREQAILCDVSPTGCRIELFDAVAQLGSTIIFEVDEKLGFAGEVVWVRGIEAGVRFSRPLLPKILTALDLD